MTSSHTPVGPRVGWNLQATRWSVLLVLVLTAGHLRGYLGNAGLEHFEELGAQLLRFDQGLWSMGPDRGGEVTGGAQLYFLLHHLLRLAGLPFWSSQGLHGLLDLAALAGWLWLAPRVLPRPLVWCAALWIALYPVPKLYLMENSVLVAFALVPMLPLYLSAVEEGGWRRILGAAALFAIALHCSLIPLPLLPVLLGYAWLVGRRPRWPLLVLLVLTPLVAVTPFLLTSHHQDSATEGMVERLACFDPAALFAGLRWTFAWNLPVLPGVALAFHRSYRDAAVRRIGRLAVVWLVVGAAPFPLSNLCDQLEPYHLTGTVAARVLLAGMAIDWALTGLGRRLGITQDTALTWLAVLFALLASLGPVSRGCAPAEHWRGEAPGRRCSATDAGAASPWDLRRVLTALEGGGHLTRGGARPVFHGAYASGLGPAWSWDAGQGNPDDRSSAGTAEEHHLLLGPASAFEGTPVPGAISVDTFLLVSGVQPVEIGLVQGVDGGYGAVLPALGEDLVYVEIEGLRCLDLERVRVAEGPGRILARVSCADVHGPGVPRTLRFGSFLVVQGQGAGPVHLDLGDLGEGPCAPPVSSGVRWASTEGGRW